MSLVPGVIAVPFVAVLGRVVVEDEVEEDMVGMPF
jgi:hypothetical protein